MSKLLAGHWSKHERSEPPEQDIDFKFANKVALVEFGAVTAQQNNFVLRATSNKRPKSNYSRVHPLMKI